jgi:hypothetical protein
MTGTSAPGRPSLLHAAMTDDTDTVSALLSEGADPDVPDRLGFTALHLAAQEGAISAAATLLAGGARVDAVNSYGNAPLFTAVFSRRGRGEVIRLLRDHGASPWHPNNAGQTPAGLACLIANYDVAQFFADLTEAGPNRPNQTSREPPTPLPPTVLKSITGSTSQHAAAAFTAALLGRSGGRRCNRSARSGTAPQFADHDGF